MACIRGVPERRVDLDKYLDQIKCECGALQAEEPYSHCLKLPLLLSMKMEKLMNSKLKGGHCRFSSSSSAYHALCRSFKPEIA